MNLTFLPWVRQGLSAAITSSAPAPRPLVEIRVELEAAGVGAPVPINAELFGPGDVLAMDPAGVIRTLPARGALLPHDELVAIEFDRADFPWLFSPKPVDSQGRLEPWIALVVLEKQSLVRLAPAPSDATRPPVLSIEGEAVRELPDLSESWAWAHGQVLAAASPDTAELARLVRDEPAYSISRLIAPRRLDKGKQYLACVVPAFDAGRRAGLGLAPGTDLAPAWRGNESSVELPVYYHWDVQVSEQATFRELAARLEPEELAPEVGRRKVVVEPLPGSASGPFETAVAGVFCVPARAADDPRPTGFADELSALQSQPNTLVPPRYGETHAPALPPWLHALNRDIELRVASALGTTVVQAQQEPLVAAVWELKHKLAEAAPPRPRLEIAGLVTNTLAGRLARSKAAARVLSTVKRPAGADLVVATPALRRLLARARAVAAPVETPRVTTPPVAEAPRVTTPRVAEATRVTASRIMETRPLVIAATLDAVTPAPVTPAAPVGPSTFGGDRRLDPEAITASAVAGAPGASTYKLVSEREAFPSGEARLTVQYTTLRLRPAIPRLTRPTRTIDPRRGGDGDIPDVETEVWVPGTMENKLFPVPWHLGQPGADSPAAASFRAAARVLQDSIARPPLPLFKAAVKLFATARPAELLAAVLPLVQPARVLPEPSGLTFRYPMWQAVAELGAGHLVPNLERVPANRVGVLSVNGRFVEALLVGLNHEMFRELRWRNVPLDGAPTLFQSFFTSEPEVAPLAGWRTLGAELSPAVASAAVLLIRGDLIRSHPNVTLYAMKGADIRYPLFRGLLDHDTLFAGFAIPRAELGRDWQFALAEQVTEPSFRTALPPGPLNVSALGLPPGASSSAVAGMLLRRPVRVLIPSARLVPPSP
jgi:hypothetical protein